MTSLDYSNLNHSYLSDQINPFEQQKQDYVSFYYNNYYDEFPSEAELLCFDPLPPSLFDFDVDFQVPLFNPPNNFTPHFHLDHHDYTNFHVDELIIPENLQYYPCFDEYPPSLHLLTEDHNHPFQDNFSDQFFPFPNKHKLSFPAFNGFIPENYGVSQCGENCYNHYNNAGGGCGGGGGGGGGGGKIKGVSAQSKAARERRKRIKEKTEELGKLVPGGTKMNTAEMFHSAAKYVQFLQAQLGLLNTINALLEVSDKKVNLSNLPILGSVSVQEKLYAKEKCLIPMDLLPIFEKHLDFETNPSISKQINELMH